MLFVFQTCYPRKHLLKITTVSKISIPQQHIVDVEGLQEVLSKLIDLPDGDGELCHVGSIEDFKVLMWKFHKYTRCSNASRTDFSFVGNVEKIFQFSQPCPDATVSLPFFILKEDKNDVFRDKDKQKLKESYTFPVVPENSRVDALYKSLQAHQYNVELFHADKTSPHYCQFSGGGDLCVTKDVSSPLVFIAPTDEELPATELDEDTSKETSVTGGDVLSNVSPLFHGDSKLASLCIEGKKESFNLEKLKYQLWANMIVLAVRKFEETLQSFTKKELLALKQLTGYGMACSGDGIFGAYKLKMGFDKATTFITKIELGPRERLQAASLMDFTLQYYKKAT